MLIIFTFLSFLQISRLSEKDMHDRSMVDGRFITFLKSTLGQMVGTNTLEESFIDLAFWDNWPRKFYNIKMYDLTKSEFSQQGADDHADPECDPDNQLPETEPVQNESLSPSILATSQTTLAGDILQGVAPVNVANQAPPHPRQVHVVAGPPLVVRPPPSQHVSYTSSMEPPPSQQVLTSSSLAQPSYVQPTSSITPLPPGFMRQDSARQCPRPPPLRPICAVVNN